MTKFNRYRCLCSLNLHRSNLELQSLSLLFLLATQLEVLGTLQAKLSLGLALNALQTKNNLLSGLSLLVENGLGLSTVTFLFTVVSSLTLGVVTGLTSFVLGNLVLSMLAALRTFAVCTTGLRNVYHCEGA